MMIEWIDGVFFFLLGEKKLKNCFWKRSLSLNHKIGLALGHFDQARGKRDAQNDKREAV
jgi:hypothetical protein